jgi:hypothetical protein
MGLNHLSHQHAADVRIERRLSGGVP